MPLARATKADLQIKTHFRIMFCVLLSIKLVILSTSFCQIFTKTIKKFLFFIQTLICYSLFWSKSKPINSHIAQNFSTKINMYWSRNSKFLNFLARYTTLLFNMSNLLLNIYYSKPKSMSFLTKMTKMT